MYIYPSIVFLRKKKNIFFATKAKRRKKNIINLIHSIITLISQKGFFKYKSISHQIIEKKDKEDWKEFAQHNLLHSTIIWKIIEKE